MPTNSIRDKCYLMTVRKQECKQALSCPEQMKMEEEGEEVRQSRSCWEHSGPKGLEHKTGFTWSVSSCEPANSHTLSCHPSKSSHNPSTHLLCIYLDLYVYIRGVQFDIITVFFSFCLISKLIRTFSLYRYWLTNQTHTKCLTKSNNMYNYYLLL